MMEFCPILKRIFLKNGFIGDQWQFYIILAKEILFLELCKFCICDRILLFMQLSMARKQWFMINNLCLVSFMSITHQVANKTNLINSYVENLIPICCKWSRIFSFPFNNRTTHQWKTWFYVNLVLGRFPAVQDKEAPSPVNNRTLLSHLWGRF